MLPVWANRLLASWDGRPGRVPARRPRADRRGRRLPRGAAGEGRSGSRCRTSCARALLRCRCRSGPTGSRRWRRRCARDVLPHAMGNGHPAFFGWVNPPPAPAGVLASLAAAAMNPSVVSGDHADVHLERTVVRWLAELVGFPHAPGAGLLTSGASAATIVCLAGARGRACAAAGHDVRRHGLAGGPRLLAYVPVRGAQLRAARARAARVRERLPSGPCRCRRAARRGRAARARSRPTARPARRRRCWSARRAPSTPAPIDPLDALADVAAAEGLWFHVDGAYGAFGVLDPALAARYRGMERADSLTLDPHKWLGVPVDAGCALVRRADDLRDAFSLDPALPAPGRRRGGGHLRRVRPRADAAVPGAEDVGDDRRPRPRRHRRPGRARERARPRARRAGRARAGARARGRAARRRSWRSAPGRPAARPSGSRPSTARCPRPSRRAGGRS